MTISPPSWKAASLGPDGAARAVLLFLLCVLAWITWRKWGSVTIDCGREMYVPAAIAQGKHLYFDLWYPYGPLIPYWHGLLFRIFGVHLMVLYVSGLTIAAVQMLLFYSLARVFLPVSLSFACGFAFLFTALHIDIFNYVLPYSYPAAYGVVILVAMVFMIVADPFTRSRRKILTIGMLAGAAMLCKIEIGLGAFLLLLCYLALRAVAARSFKTLGRDLLSGLPGPLIAISVYGWLVWRTSAEFIFGDNIPVLPDSYFVMNYGRLWSEYMGVTLSLPILTRSIFLAFVAYVVLIGGLKLCSMWKPSRWLLLAASLAICAVQIAVVYAVFWKGRVVTPLLSNLSLRFLFYNRGLVWISIALLIVMLVRWLRRRETSREWAALFLLCCGSLALGARVLTFVLPYNYPVFYGVLPFVTAVVAVYMGAAAFRIQLGASVWRGYSAIVCATLIAVTWPGFIAPPKPFTVTSDRGSIDVEDTTGPAYAEVLGFLKNVQATSAGSFVVWPEDTSLYFFSGATAPSRWYVLAPGILPTGPKTDEYLAELDRKQVRYVVLTNRATPEYGVPIFGFDYNHVPFGWLTTRFHQVKDFGPFQRAVEPEHWGALIYERNAPPAGR